MISYAVGRLYFYSSFTMWKIQQCEVSFFIASCLNIISNSLEVLFEMRLLHRTSVDRSIVAWTGGLPERRCTAHVAVELGRVSIILSVLF